MVNLLAGLVRDITGNSDIYIPEVDPSVLTEYIQNISTLQALLKNDLLKTFLLGSFLYYAKSYSDYG
jgi:hypothetical protein